MGTSHHGAFDAWWEYAKDNYVSWENGDPVAVDLYYDPIVDEHVGRGAMGLIAPAWYFAPQRPELARTGWRTAAALAGLIGAGPINGLDNPANAVMMLQLAGELADETTKGVLWEAAEDHIQPTWDEGRGEFTLGFKLNEPHPRGQWNARAMAGWVASPGAWSKIFNGPNLSKFDEPTVEGVDFPRVAMSEARWDGTTMHLAAHPMNAKIKGKTTTIRLANLPGTDGWTASGSGATVAADGSHLEVRIVADNRPVVIRR
jgi:hypothetical protein